MMVWSSGVSWAVPRMSVYRNVAAAVWSVRPPTKVRKGAGVGLGRGRGDRCGSRNRQALQPREPVPLGANGVAQVLRERAEVRLPGTREVGGRQAVDRCEDPLVRPLVVVDQPAQLSRIR